jgi:deazaflavin-dependent oxidoreductase (nitroreductase family)
VAKVFNPLVLAIAGRRYMPIVGKVQHRGRRSGHPYTAPLGVRPLGDRFVIPVTFSEAAQWYQNIRAAGWCVVTYRGTDHNVVGPVLVDGGMALPAFPRYERLFLRLLGIHEFLSLAEAPAGWTPPAA